MGNIREVINKKPWLGWLVAGAAMCAAGYFAWRSTSEKGEYTPERMTQRITIRFTDTGDTMEISRGRLIRDMMLSGGQIDPTKGVINPKTNQPTGFPFNKDDWEKMVGQINRDLEAAKRKVPGGGPIPTPTSPGQTSPSPPVKAPR